MISGIFSQRKFVRCHAAVIMAIEKGWRPAKLKLCDFIRILKLNEGKIMCGRWLCVDVKPNPNDSDSDGQSKKNLPQDEDVLGDPLHGLG